jgi:Glycosyltransferase family 87
VTTAIKPASWLTARRVFVHGSLLAACLWIVYAVTLSTPGLLDRNGLLKGTDFLNFYTLGSLARQGRGDLLYDMRAQATFAQKLLPEAAGYYYVPLYGPQVSLLFEPFAKLSYGWALATWLSLNILIYSLCCYAVWRRCPNLQGEGRTVLILAIAFPGFFYLLAFGQNSGLALACFTLAFLAVQRAKPWLAGFAIGSLVFKPQLGLAAAVVFIFAREWKVVAGALAAALAQLGWSWEHYGTQVMRNYGRALSHFREVFPLVEPRLYQTHSLGSFWSLLLPWPRAAFGLSVASAIGVLALTVLCWRAQASLAIRYSALLLATVLVAPHLTVYDLVILAPAFLLLGDWAADRDRERSKQYSARTVQLLLYACYPLFLLGPLARFTNLQLSVVAVSALLWTSWRISSPQLAS